MNPTTTGQRQRTGWRRVGYLARRATMLEIRGYQSIFRFVLRRPRVPAGTVGFSYHQPVFRHPDRVRERVRPRIAVIIDDTGHATLHLHIQNETNIEVRLARPVTVRLPSGPETMTQINLYADDPKAFVSEVRRHQPT